MSENTEDQLDEQVESVLANFRAAVEREVDTLLERIRDQCDVINALTERVLRLEQREARFFAPHPIGTVSWIAHSEDGTSTEYTRRTFPIVQP